MADIQEDHPDAAVAVESDDAPKHEPQPYLAICLCIIAGMMFGAGLIFIPFYFTYNSLSLTCPEFTSAAACAGSKHGGCVWTSDPGADPAGNATAAPSCKYSDYTFVHCPSRTSQDACDSDECVWSVQASECRHKVGFNAVEQGLFAASYFIGCSLGPLAVNLVLHTMPFRAGFAFFGMVGLLSTVLVHIARATDSFAALFIGFLGFGFCVAGGRLCAAVISFAVAGSPAMAGFATSFSQPTTELAQLIGAVYTFVLRPANFDGDRALETRIHCFLVFWHVLCVALIVVAAMVREPPRKTYAQPAAPKVAETRNPLTFIKVGDGTGEEGIHDDQEAVEAEPEEPPVPPPGTFGCGQGANPLPPEGLMRPVCAHPGKVFVGVTMCASLLFTGLAAMTAYAPVYFEDLIGVKPEVASLVTSGCGTAAGLLAFGVRRLITRARPVMLAGSLGLFVTNAYYALMIMPGVVADDSTRHVLTLLGIISFFVFIDAFVGSTFFELALSIQPPHIRAGGGAILNAALNIFSLLLSFLFPIAVTGISGGPSGNQLVGYSACFFFFAVVGLVCFGVQLPLMHPYDEVLAKEQQEQDAKELETQSASPGTTTPPS